jgi:hypothetical protein
MKVLSEILHFYGNITSSGEEYMQKILKETSLTYAIHHIIRHFKVIPDEILSKLSWFADNFTRFWLKPENVDSENEVLEVTIAATNYVIRHSKSYELINQAI